jgi:hypothetical protein
MYDVEVGLMVYDVAEDLLIEDDKITSPLEVSLELTHNHTFIDLMLAVEPDVLAAGAFPGADRRPRWRHLRARVRKSCRVDLGGRSSWVARRAWFGI